MSLETWKEEFYPTSAAQPMTAREAIEHSLRKWRGLTDANLAKHQVTKKHRWIIDYFGGSLEIDNETCALCYNFQIIDDKTGLQDCKACPLYVARSTRCDRGFTPSPYAAFVMYGDPCPMIKLLEEVLHAS